MVGEIAPRRHQATAILAINNPDRQDLLDHYAVFQERIAACFYQEQRKSRLGQIVSQVGHTGE